MYINAPLGKWIGTLYKHHDQFVDQYLKKLDLNHNEGNLLVYLYKDGDGISQDKIAKNLGLNKATISRTVAKLKDKDYITIKEWTKDKRVHHIYLAEKAKAKKQTIREIYQKWYDIFLKEVPEAEAEIIIKNLKKMYNIIQNEID